MDEQFAKICGVPAERRRTGRSVLEIVRASGYEEFQRQFTARDLAVYLRSRPDIIAEWVAYSQDKRTSDGWYLRPPYSIGRISADSPPMQEIKHVDLAAACAAFITAELSSILNRAVAD
jgi:hypothetical protein